jgi:hypothetical protein
MVEYSNPEVIHYHASRRAVYSTLKDLGRMRHNRKLLEAAITIGGCGW